MNYQKRKVCDVEPRAQRENSPCDAATLPRRLNRLVSRKRNFLRGLAITVVLLMAGGLMSCRPENLITEFKDGHEPISFAFDQTNGVYLVGQVGRYMALNPDGTSRWAVRNTFRERFVVRDGYSYGGDSGQQGVVKINNYTGATERLAPDLGFVTAIARWHSGIYCLQQGPTTLALNLIGPDGSINQLFAFSTHGQVFGGLEFVENLVLWRIENAPDRHSLFVFDLSEGRLRYKTDIALGTSALSVDAFHAYGDSVYFLDRDGGGGHIVRMNLSSGMRENLWFVPGDYTAALLFGGGPRLYIPSSEGIAAYDVENRERSEIPGKWEYVDEVETTFYACIDGSMVKFLPDGTRRTLLAGVQNLVNFGVDQGVMMTVSQATKEAEYEYRIWQIK